MVKWRTRFKRLSIAFTNIWKSYDQISILTHSMSISIANNLPYAFSMNVNDLYEMKYDSMRFFLHSPFLFRSLSLLSLFYWCEFKYSIHFDTAVLRVVVLVMVYSSLAFVIESSEIKTVAAATTSTHMLPVIVVCLSLVTNQPRTR